MVTSFRAYTLSIGVAAAILAGCGGLESPIDAPAALAKSAALGVPSNKLLYFYFTDTEGQGYLYVTSFPPKKFVGAFGPSLNFEGICRNGKGTVFLLQWASRGVIYEFAHGAKIGQFEDRDGYPTGCATDPTSGDFAVTNSRDFSGKAGSVSIYSPSHGTPTRYKDRDIFAFDYDAYDDRGNLFVDGHTKSGSPVFAELAKGAKAFKKLTLDKNVGRYPTNLQWIDGELTIATQFGQNVYRVAIDGAKGKILGSTSLGECAALDTYIYDAKIVANCSGDFVVFRYPKGGPSIGIVSLKDTDP